MTTNKYRTLWISDLHIGSTQCHSEMLLDFLKHNESEKLYLVGDIIDLWALSKKGMYWPPEHNTIIQKLLRKARHGTKVVYIPGNHDDPLRYYDGHVFGDIEVKIQDTHTTVDGKKLLIVHGDEYDLVAQNYQWLAHIGSLGYDWLIEINRWLRPIRRWLGFQSNFSLSAFVKYKVKNAVQFMSNYEEAIVTSLKDGSMDGVVCGHIHHAEIKEIDSFLYINTGDFVESCTAIAEHYDGSLELIRWKKHGSVQIEAIEAE